MLSDPAFLAVAIPAVILVGLSKGGLGGGMGLIGVPLLSVVISPIQAAAILLPIMLLMDAVSLWTWRGQYDRRTLDIMVPGALAGISFGWLTAALVTPDAVRLIIGVITVSFVLRWLWQKVRHTDGRAGHRPWVGRFWGAVSGFTSFVAHAGGPPFQVYALPLGHKPATFTGTAVVFFALTNAVKVVPYFALGQFGMANLSTSLALAPIAPVATLFGAWVVKRMKPEVFYPLTYGTVFLVSLKLIWDGLAVLTQ